jgi:cell wall assembly regulator SMI1
MNWLQGKKDCSLENIKHIEDSLSIKLPQNFITVLLSNDGAYPEKNLYDFGNEKEKIVQCLLSCKNDSNSILVAAQRIGKKNIVPFMKDPFGNYICFQFTNLQDYEIILWDHDTEITYKITDSFENFVNMLY